jgi:CheY-like chemotaxis protein
MQQQLPKDLLIGWEVVAIDDEEDSLEVIEILLTEYGATVTTASNGKKGLEAVRKVNPRLVISDVSMPEMDGWGFIHAMKNDPATKAIPVLALTAHAMLGDRELALTAGFHNYLSKPLTIDTFINDLIKLLIDIPELVEYLNI